MTAKKIYFKNLDGLRFLCFLAVFFYHSFQTESAAVKASPIYKLVKFGLVENGFLGVNFFFVLSGFLITYLLIKEKELNRKINIPNFWVRRILRIWPLYYACVFIGFALFPFAKEIMGGQSEETANIWYYLTFTNNFDYINKGMPDAPGLGVLWSIAIEEQFYFIWPLLLAIFPVKKYWIVFSLVILSSLTFRAFNDVPEVLELHTLSCIGDMAVGGFGAWLILFSKKVQFYMQHVSKLQLVLLYLCLISIFLFRNELFTQHYVTRIFERFYIAIIMLLVILEQCYTKSSLFKMSNFPTISNLGIITYGLYCFHFFVISGVSGVGKITGLQHNTFWILLAEPILGLLITILISKISYKYFETPFLKLKDKFSYFRKK